MGQNIYNTPEDLLRGIKADFFDKLGKAPEPNVKPFTYFTTSTNDNEHYVFSDVYPGIEKIIDEVNLSSLKAYEVIVRNEDFGGGIREKKSTIDDGNAAIGGSNMIDRTIANMVTRYNTLPAKLIQTLLTANGNAFDGTAFFANDRPALKGSSVIDNIVSGTGTTLAQVSADMTSAATQMNSMKDRNGDPFNPVADFAVYVPPQLEWTFKKLRTTETVSNPYDNVWKDGFQIIVNKQQDPTNNDWYLVNLAADVPPFIYQVRKKPVFEMDEKKGSLYVNYDVMARMGAGYGNPMAIIKVDNA